MSNFKQESRMVFCEQKKREIFMTDPRAQSRLLENSKDEMEIMEWIRRVTDDAGWK